MRTCVLTIKGGRERGGGVNHERYTSQTPPPKALPAGEGIVQQSHDVLYPTRKTTTHRRVPGR